MNLHSSSLASRAEAAIRSLRDIDSVSVHAEGNEIREIHVLTSADRTGKNVSRDVETVLRAKLGLGIDHKVISVAFSTREGDGGAAVATSAPDAPDAPGASEAPAEWGSAGGREDAPTGERIQFEGVNLFVSGPRTQAQVELRWKGLPRIGSAVGWSARDEAHFLVAQASAAAVQEFLADPIALNVQGVEFQAFGRHRVAVVALSLVAHRQEKLLTGTCPIDQDTPQAVVLATLDALNRVVGGLRVKEPTEYVLRTTTS